MKTSALALSTALSLLAFAPAYAQDLTGVDPNCIMTNADGTKTVDMTKCPDGKTMSSSGNTTTAPADQNAAETPAPADQNAAETPPAAPADQNTADTPAPAEPADQNAAQTPAPSDATPEQTTGATATDNPPTASTTAPSDMVIIVPADVLKGAKVMSASDYIGKRVYDRAGNDIGEVNDLIISDDGKVQATILGVGGFLGIGEKDVAVSVSAVEMVQDGNSVRLVVDATKEQLEQAPTFDRSVRNYAS